MPEELENEIETTEESVSKKNRKKTDLPSLILALLGIVLALTVQGLAIAPLLAGFIVALQRRERKKIALAIVLCVLGLVLAVAHMVYDGFWELMG